MGEKEDRKGDDEKEEKKKRQPQIPPEEASNLIKELSPKLKEELANVLRYQDKPEGERPGISRELHRVLQRCQRRLGIGPDGKLLDQGEETWPMYLGIALFIIIFCLLTGIWIQETYFGEKEIGPDYDEDPYWWTYGKDF